MSFENAMVSLVTEWVTCHLIPYDFDTAISTPAISTL